MSENDRENLINRAYYIDAGKDFIIPQYINFFLCALEELLEEALVDINCMPSVMKPFNEGYMLLVEYLKLHIFSRRHASKIVEKFNEGYMKVMDPELPWDKMRFTRFADEAHMLMTKICHLVHYEQRYACSHQTQSSMLTEYSIEELITYTRLHINEVTCKSKERPEFNSGYIYIKGCNRLICDINKNLVTLCHEQATHGLRTLLLRGIDLYTIVKRLENLTEFIKTTKKISRPYICREVKEVHHLFQAFETDFLTIFSMNEQSAETVPSGCSAYSKSMATTLKSLAVNLVSLRWGLYFLTLTYGSGHINQSGEIEVREIRIGKVDNSISFTSCTIS